MQVHKLAHVLRSMEQGERNRQHQVENDAALVGWLRSSDVLPMYDALGKAYFKASTKAVKSASIGGGTAVVRTVSENSTAGRTTTEYWAFLPHVRADGTLNACVLQIQQLLLVSCSGLS